jgi:hypothetical protein
MMQADPSLVRRPKERATTKNGWDGAISAAPVYNWLLCAAGLVECDEATTVPVDYEAVPGQTECKHMMTAPVEHEAVPRPRVPPEVPVRAPVNAAPASLFDVGLCVG